MINHRRRRRGQGGGGTFPSPRELKHSPGPRAGLLLKGGREGRGDREVKAGGRERGGRGAEEGQEGKRLTSKGREGKGGGGREEEGKERKGEGRQWGGKEGGPCPPTVLKMMLLGVAKTFLWGGGKKSRGSFPPLPLPPLLLTLPPFPFLPLPSLSFPSPFPSLPPLRSRTLKSS